MKKIFILTSLLGFIFSFSQVQNGVKTEPQKDSSRDVYVPEADKPAEFPGGMNAFRNLIVKEFKTSKMKKASGTFRASVKFAVGIDGKISSVTVKGENEIFNNEIQRVFESIKKEWKPATYKDYPVKYWFQVPITMVF